MTDLHTKLPPNKRTKGRSKKPRPQNGNGRIAKPRNFAELLAAFDNLYISQKHKTEASRKMHRIRAGQFCIWCEAEGIGLNDLSAWEIESYLSGLTNRRDEPLKPNSVNGHARLIKTIIRWAARHDLIPQEIDFDMPDTSEVQIEYLTDQQQAELMTHPDIHPRDRAFVKFILDTGARLAEALKVNWGDIQFDESTSDGAAFIANGKGGKSRLTFITSETWALLNEWADEFKGGYKSPNEPVFAPYTDQHYKPGARLTPRGADHIFRRLSETLGFRVRAHVLRHTAVRNSKMRGASDDWLMVYFGWTSPEMPRRYGKLIAHDMRLIWRNLQRNGTG